MIEKKTYAFEGEITEQDVAMENASIDENMLENVSGGSGYKIGGEPISERRLSVSYRAGAPDTENRLHSPFCD